jgi:hypothetical protein
MKLTTTKRILAAFGVALLTAACHADTPEKLDDPDALLKTHANLASFPDWKQFATPEQIKLFDGPEAQWQTTPQDQYDYSGFDKTMLGSPVPPPGVHPRVLMSPQDVPVMFKRLQSCKAGQKSLLETEFVLNHTIWDASTDDGKVFAKLSSGDVADLKFEPLDDGKDASGILHPPMHQFVGYQPVIVATQHNGYWPALLHTAALYCLLTGDNDHGKAVATAIYNYWKLREPLIDRRNNDYAKDGTHPNDLWRGMHQLVGNNHLGFDYDLGAVWMNDEQKTLMRRVIAKATAGKRAYGENGPLRWRVTNWTGWDQEFTLVALSIEGEDGYDPALLPIARDTLESYLTWEFDPSGTIYETNGKNGAGIKYGLMAMLALARRGDNLFGHPHLIKHTATQVQSYTPAADQCVNNGDWGCAKFGNAGAFLAFYPGDKNADWLLRQVAPDWTTFDLDQYRKQLESSARANDRSPTSWRRIEPLTASDLFSCVDWHGDIKPDGTLREAWERDYLKLPLTFNDPDHGLLETRSGNDKNALFMSFEARPDLRSIGHQHHDAGQFYLEGEGQMWASEAGPLNPNSPDHNTILIDGLGHSDVSAAPRVKYLGAAVSDAGAIASADLSNAYNYGWTTPMHFSWQLPEAKDWKLSPETDPEVVEYFKGTQHWKMRIWADDYWHNTWGPTMRIASDNPVKYAFRSAGIVRGTHPWAIVVDDIAKDDQSHHYQWLMQVPDPVRIAAVHMPKQTVPGVALTRTPQTSEDWRMRTDDTIPHGTPMLLMLLVDAQSPTFNQDSPFMLEQRDVGGRQPGSTTTSKRLVISRRAIDPGFKIVMIPFKSGDALPESSWDKVSSTLTLMWHDQKDVVAFNAGEDHRTRLTVHRDETPLIEVR